MATTKAVQSLLRFVLLPVLVVAGANLCGPALAYWILAAQGFRWWSWLLQLNLFYALGSLVILLALVAYLRPAQVSRRTRQTSGGGGPAMSGDMAFGRAYRDSGGGGGHGTHSWDGGGGDGGRWRPEPAANDSVESSRSCLLSLFTGLVLCVLVACMVVTIAACLWRFLEWVHGAPWFRQHNLWVFTGIVAIFLLLAVLGGALGRLTWKTLSDLWLKPPAIAAVAVGGFGLADFFKDRVDALLKSAANSPYANTGLLLSFALAAIGLLVIAALMYQVGRSRAESEDAKTPRLWLFASFAPSYVACLLIYAVVFDCFFLTVDAYLPRVEPRPASRNVVVVPLVGPDALNGALR